MEQKNFTKKDFEEINHQIEKAEQLVRRLEQERSEMQENCEHVVKNSWGSAKCAICDADLGDYCKKSPDHVCEYEYKEYDDICIHCGQPEERK